MGGAGSKEDEETCRQNPQSGSSSTSGYPGIPSYGPPPPQQYPGIPSYGLPPPQQYPGIPSYGPPQPLQQNPSQQYSGVPEYGPPSHQYYPSHGQESQSYGRQDSYPSQPSQEFGGDRVSADGRKKYERRYSRIADNYHSLEQVTEALARAGLESSNLIIGIDFTKSNEWTGSKSFNRRSLHHIGDGLNPYEQAISIVGKTLSAFDEDNVIPCFGFGDASTHDQDVFSFYPDERYCNGFEEVLSRYREIVPHLKLAGPTSFAPIIEMAMTIVERSSGQYHVLLIIADGQVTRSVDTEKGQLSPQEQKTVDAIVKASKFPLSIILVGVGDGPWDTMKEFDDNIPARDFDNFQFVNSTYIMSKNVPQSRKETEFALTALMEVPAQYKATIELKILGGRKGNAPERVPLPPPVNVGVNLSSSISTHPAGYKQHSSPPNYQPSVPPYPGDDTSLGSAPPAPSISYDQLLCPICLSNTKDMAFGCGHQTCGECAPDLELCPICRSPIQTRIKLY